MESPQPAPRPAPKPQVAPRRQPGAAPRSPAVLIGAGLLGFALSAWLGFRGRPAPQNRGAESAACTAASVHYMTTQSKNTLFQKTFLVRLDNPVCPAGTTAMPMGEHSKTWAVEYGTESCFCRHPDEPPGP